MIENLIGAFVCLMVWTMLSSGAAFYLTRAFFGKPKKIQRDDDDVL